LYDNDAYDEYESALTAIDDIDNVLIGCVEEEEEEEEGEEEEDEMEFLSIDEEGDEHPDNDQPPLDDNDDNIKVPESAVMMVAVETDKAIINNNNKQQNASQLPAVNPTNVLLDYKSLQECMKCFACPLCLQKPMYVVKPEKYRTLQLSQIMNGFASEVTISCKHCKEDIATVAPKDKRPEFQGKGSKGSFMKYVINYFSVVMMQQLGMGIDGLATILSFLGLVPGIGGTEKWKDIQETVGAAVG
jgi:hypothetical protein